MANRIYREEKYARRRSWGAVMPRVLGTLTLALIVLCTTGCVKCIKVGNLAPVPSTPQIVHNKVVIEQATLPNGQPSDLSVRDYHPPQGDGINEIVVGWSKTDSGLAEHASIDFPQADFGAGPRKVWVTAMHYNSCSLEAKDVNGAVVDSEAHTLGQRQPQILALSGGRISSVDVAGAEIGVKEICYRR